MSLLNSPKDPLHGIFRDSESRKVWSWCHGTKAFRTSVPQDEDANNLEAYVPLTYSRDIGASHKGRAHEAARTRIAHRQADARSLVGAKLTRHFR
jgi:hypothetical protein